MIIVIKRNHQLNFMNIFNILYETKSPRIPASAENQRKPKLRMYYFLKLCELRQGFTI